MRLEAESFKIQMASIPCPLTRLSCMTFSNWLKSARAPTNCLGPAHTSPTSPDRRPVWIHRALADKRILSSSADKTNRLVCGGLHSFMPGASHLVVWYFCYALNFSIAGILVTTHNRKKFGHVSPAAKSLFLPHQYMPIYHRYKLPWHKREVLCSPWFFQLTK